MICQKDDPLLMVGDTHIYLYITMYIFLQSMQEITVTSIYGAIVHILNIMNHKVLTYHINICITIPT